MDIKPSLLASFQALSPVSSDPAELAKSYAQGRIFSAVIEQVTPKPQTNNLNPLFEILVNAQGRKIIAASNQAFNVGQLLTVEVTQDGSLRVLQIVQSPAEKQQQLIQQGLRQALPLQQNHSALLNRLAPLAALIGQLNQTADNTVLQQLQRQINELVSSLPRQDQLQNTHQLKQVIAQNGSFLEAKLQRLLQQLSPASTATPSAQPSSERTISAILKQNPNLLKPFESLIGQDLKAQLVKLAAQLAPLATHLRISDSVSPPAANSPRGAPLNTTPGTASNANTNSAALTSRLANDIAKTPQPTAPELTGAGAAVIKANNAARQTLGASAYNLGNSAPGATPGASPRPSLPSYPNNASAITPAATATTGDTTPGETTTVAAQLIARIIQATMGANAGLSSRQQSQTQPRIEIPDLLINTHSLMLLKKAGVQVSNTQTSMPREAFDLAVSTLLRQIASSIAKIQTNQYKSVAGQRGATDSAVINSWHVEIPVFSEGLFRPIQLQIDEERSADQAKDAKQGRQWKITLGFDFEELGEFFSTLTLVENTLSATFWSERPQTLRRIESELNILRNSLTSKGLNIKQIDCCKGRPPVQKSRLDQQLVDIKT